MIAVLIVVEHNWTQVLLQPLFLLLIYTDVIQTHPDENVSYPHFEMTKKGVSIKKCYSSEYTHI